jgi:hypothetical protein
LFYDINVIENYFFDLDLKILSEKLLFVALGLWAKAIKVAKFLCVLSFLYVFSLVQK